MTKTKTTFQFSESQQRMLLATCVSVEFLSEFLIQLGLPREELIKMNLDFLTKTVGFLSIEETRANLATFLEIAED